MFLNKSGKIIKSQGNKFKLNLKEIQRFKHRYTYALVYIRTQIHIYIYTIYRANNYASDL